MVMRVFVAGGTGALGRRLVPQLVALGHRVTATTTGPATSGRLGAAPSLVGAGLHGCVGMTGPA
jgi:nucleoside-diphosphate-sugar epimerase